MAKKVKFPLDMGNDVMVRSIEELKANYNAEKVTEYFLNGKLLTWLENRYYDEEAEQVRELSEQSDSNPAAKLGAIFGIETEEEVDVETLEIRRKKLEKLREITSEDEIIKNVDFVAFSQEELGDLLDEEADVIYLCGESFRIPLSVKNVRYVGVNDPVVTVSGKGDIDLEANGIIIERCEFSEDTKARLVGKAAEKDEEFSITSMEGIENFEIKNEDGCISIVRYIGNDKDVKIPDGVNEISLYAFKDCRTIESVVIPDSVSCIGPDAFYDCKSLKNVILGNNENLIFCGSVFHGCSSLESINIPANVRSIGIAMFDECTNLKKIDISYGVREIGDDAFNKCKKLVSVNIPNSVDEIGSSAFSYCKSLRKISIPYGVKTIESYTFIGCENLVNVDIPDSVTEIKRCAFSKCGSIETLCIPKSVVKVDAEAFRNADDLLSLYETSDFDIEYDDEIYTIEEFCNFCSLLGYLSY